MKKRFVANRFFSETGGNDHLVGNKKPRGGGVLEENWWS